jgi:hypothetical protein
LFTARFGGFFVYHFTLNRAGIGKGKPKQPQLLLAQGGLTITSPVEKTCFTFDMPR